MSLETPEPILPEDLPPLADWPPREILERRERWQREQRRKRQIHHRVAAGIVALLMLATAAVVLSRQHHRPVAAVPPIVRRSPQTVVWSVQGDIQRFVVVVGSPAGRGPVALAIPGDVAIDIPGGPPDVEAASAQTGLLVAAAQASLGRRVDHFLTSDSASFMALVDRLGPIDVQAEVAFSAAGLEIGPGPVKLSGAQTMAYLDQATVEDGIARWEEVLAGLFATGRAAVGWSGPLGLSDDDSAIRSIMQAAEGAVVLELPTIPAEQGGLLPDPAAAPKLLAQEFGPPGELIRVVVLSGAGQPTAAADIAARLAPAGYRVVAEQPSVDRHTVLTQIVASGDAFVDRADQVKALLGVGMVYVGGEPTGIADITVVVGKDLAGA